ncbi:hypothetical protein ACFPM3_18420 [Streptomyces coeruleoprunus]|uniref:Lipoprotein n=1 Tax=Streptomyces coeruleoprunus TaxID=285563 RepID=A0ABV9XI33_9ACTN
MTFTRAAAGPVLAAALMLLTGCSGTGQRAAGAPAATSAAVAPRPLTEAEQLRVTDAQQRLIQRCMARHGFSYWPVGQTSLEESRTHGYVSDDVTWAGKHGYGGLIRTKEERARRTNPNIAHRQGLTPERRAAYDKALDQGVDAPVLTAELPGGGTVRKRVGGCVADAERQLYGDPQVWFRAEKTAMSLQPLYVPKIIADPGFQKALSAWKQCMKRAGHPYPDPPAARRAAEQRAARTTPEKAFPAERELAVADAGCARRSSLRTVGKEREAHYVAQLRGQYGEALDTYARLRLRALARAADVVAPRA